jgi:hypothetical protein
MEMRNNYKVTARLERKVRQLVLLLLLIVGGLLVISVKQSVEGSPAMHADRYYLRVSGCDDGGRAYLNNNLIVDVGFDEDSNWLDITEDVVKGKDEIKFEVVNRTGAITYLFQVKKNDTIIFEQACGKVKEIGCENNRAFRVGKARKFTYTIRRDE